MEDKWKLADSIIEALAFAVEYVTFSLFIYEEACQLSGKYLLTFIEEDNKHDLRLDLFTVHEWIMAKFTNDFNLFGIVSLYACNAYSTYLYSSQFLDEWAHLYLGGDRMEYTFQRTGIL